MCQDFTGKLDKTSREGWLVLGKLSFVKTTAFPRSRVMAAGGQQTNRCAVHDWCRAGDMLYFEVSVSWNDTPKKQQSPLNEKGGSSK